MWQYRFKFFFFSSRRRHTRYIGDWSSDVCSSDLYLLSFAFIADLGELNAKLNKYFTRDGKLREEASAEQIGRASCRERVEIAVVVGAVKKKNEWVAAVMLDAHSHYL